MKFEFEWEWQLCTLMFDFFLVHTNASRTVHDHAVRSRHNAHIWPLWIQTYVNSNMKCYVSYKFWRQNTKQLYSDVIVLTEMQKNNCNKQLQTSTQLPSWKNVVTCVIWSGEGAGFDGLYRLDYRLPSRSDTTSGRTIYVPRKKQSQ